MKVMTVSLQLAWNMNTSTMAAWVRERTTTLMFKQIWSETVVVSADNLLVISPARSRLSELLLSRTYNQHRMPLLAALHCRSCNSNHAPVLLVS